MGKIRKGFVVLTKKGRIHIWEEGLISESCRFQHLVMLWDILGAFLSRDPYGGDTPCLGASLESRSQLCMAGGEEQG